MRQTTDFVSHFPKRGYLALGLSLRLILAPFLSHPFDMRVFMAVGAAVAKGITPYGQYVLQAIFAGTPHPHLYGTVPGIGYPPPWGLTCGLMYLLSSAITPNNLYAYILTLKLPIIVAELAVALLIYRMLKTETNEKVASQAFLLFLFCPFLIAVGTVWGMFDIIALLFTLISAYWLHNNWKSSSISLSIASALKLFPLTLAPLFAVLLYKSTRKLKTAFHFFLVTLALTSLLTFIPMFAYNWPISNMYNALVYHVSAAGTPYDGQVTHPISVTSTPYDNQAAFPYGAASPFNAFTLLNNVSNAPFQPPWISIYLWIPACVAVYVFLLRKHKPKTKHIGFASTVQWSLLLFVTLFSTRVWVSEQNLTFLFAFLALSVFLLNLRDSGTVQLLWILLLGFVIVHVPALSFLWLPYPWTLDAASSFANGSSGWVRLLIMTLLTFSWLALSWHYVIKKLRWKL